MAYGKLGNLSVIPAADLTSAASNANKGRGTAVNAQDGAIGKTEGMMAIRAGTVGTFTTYSVVLASGSAPTDVWIDLSAIGTVYTPS